MVLLNWHYGREGVTVFPILLFVPSILPYNPTSKDQNSQRNCDDGKIPPFWQDLKHDFAIYRRFCIEKCHTEDGLLSISRTLEIEWRGDGNLQK